MCTRFRWASLGFALSWGPSGTDAQKSAAATPGLQARSKKAAEMTVESHSVHRKKRSREHRGEEERGWGEQGGGAGVWKAGLDRARMGLQGAGGEMVLLTDVTAGRGGSRGIWQAGPGPAHLSLPFWMEAWPRLVLSKSGEFLLRFVLVERTLFCGE